MTFFFGLSIHTRLPIDCIKCVFPNPTPPYIKNGLYEVPGFFDIAKAALEATVRYLAASAGTRGLRVNAISAGPIRTLAAAGIKDFRKIQSAYAQMTPLKRNVTAEEVGHTAAFLCSSLASGITGEVVHVDAGYHAVAMSSPES